jgi:hypothetical protein
MGGRAKRGRHGQSLAIIHAVSSSPNSIQSCLSTKIVTPVFFESGPSAISCPANQAHGQTSQTWKSKETIKREEFEEILQSVQHFAPEQYKSRAKPGNRPAEIVPQTYEQYNLYLHEISLEQAKNQLALMEAKKLVKSLPEVMPAFNGKSFQPNRSAVLSQNSIWSREVLPTYQHPTVAWPGREELHEDGEKRENVHAPTRCGRFPPALRHPETGTYMQQYPLDQVGPIRSQGPTPREAEDANNVFDFDASFEAEGVELLGSDLMKELGEHQPPFVPEWLAEKRYKTIVLAQYYQQVPPLEEW